MKYCIIALCLIIAGCVTLKQPVAEESCIDHANYPNSEILKRLDNPCATHKMIVTAVQSGVLLEAIEYEEMEKTIDAIDEKLATADVVMAGNVKLVLVRLIGETNKKAGAVALLLSNTFLEFPDEVPFFKSDIALLRLALADLKVQLKALTLLQ
jgi:hypothetical protein